MLDGTPYFKPSNSVLQFEQFSTSRFITNCGPLKRARLPELNSMIILFRDKRDYQRVNHAYMTCIKFMQCDFYIFGIGDVSE